MPIPMSSQSVVPSVLKDTPAQRERRQLIEAAIGLVLETQSLPRALDVAKRAGVPVSTFNRHFADITTFFEACADHIFAEGDRIGHGDTDGLGRADRIAFHVRVRAELCVAFLPLVRWVKRPGSDGAFLLPKLGLSHFLQTQCIEAMYWPELSVLPEAERQRVILAIDLLVDYERWGSMTETAGLSFDEACALWRESIDRLLPPTPEEPNGLALKKIEQQVPAQASRNKSRS
jgi:AcrR family transcriptional regulator